MWSAATAKKSWITRRARYGVTGTRLSELCQKQLHPMTPENTIVSKSGEKTYRRCRACRRNAKQRWRETHREQIRQRDRCRHRKRATARTYPAALIRTTGDVRWILRWATRREKHGRSGFTPAALEALRTRRKYGTHLKSVCKRGHRFTDKSTRWRTRRRKDNGEFYKTRECSICERERNIRRRRAQQRPHTIMHENVQINIRVHDDFVQRRWRLLRKRRLAAHPDAGGTSRKFRLATEELEKFMQIEAAWYQQYGLTLPKLVWSKSREKAA